MERKIKRTFIDKSSNIYIVDIMDILYLYDDNQFYPFMEIMNDIKDCFFIHDRFFVHHGKTISIFDEYLFKIPMTSESWITNKIDMVCYSNEENIIITLEDGEVYINFGVTNKSGILDDEVQRISLSNKYFKFEEIKVINDLLITYKNNTIGLFALMENNIDFVSSINVDKKIFNNITQIDWMNNLLILENSDKLSFSGKLYIQNYIDPYSYNLLFNIQQAYFLYKDGYLMCSHSPDKLNTIIKPLEKILPVLNSITVDTQTKYHQLTTFTLPKNIDLSIIQNNTKQIIIYNNRPLLIDQILYEISLTDESVYYDNFDIQYMEKSDTNMIIDIDISVPIIKQLINIIPFIYRLNDEMIYKFEQVDSDSNVISYGDGVTRHIFNSLRKEIDIVLEKKFLSYDLTYAFNLGKLLYFCNREGAEKFFNIHPYFFYKFSNSSDHVTLLKKFKGNSFNIFHSQYIQYINNPKSLEELELGINTPDQYICYLLSSDLTEEQIKHYDAFIKGFNIFYTRNKSYSVLKKLPILCLINQLVGDDFFKANLEYFAKNRNVDTKHFEDFQKIFRKLFGQLSKKEMACFVQNITGSQYYTGTINIVLAYEKKELIVHQAVYDENIFIGQEEPLEVNDIIIVLDNDKTDENKLIYQISTCNAELIINVLPNEENLTSIIKILTVEDLNMKN